MRRRLIRLCAAPALATALSLAAACSGATPYDYGSAASASTGGAGVSSTVNTGPRLPPASDTSAPPALASSTIVFPGLTAECSSAVHVQAAVTELFATALAAGPPPTSGALVVSGTAAPGPPPLTAADIAAALDHIEPPIPAALSSQVAVLRDAAVRSIGKPATAIPAILEAAPVAKALDELSAYIAECRPAGSEATTS